MLRLVKVILAIGLLQAFAAAGHAGEKPKLEKPTLDAAMVAMTVITLDRARAVMTKPNRR